MESSLLGMRVRFAWRELLKPDSAQRLLVGRVVLVTCDAGVADSTELLVAVAEGDTDARLYAIKNIEAVRVVVDSMQGASL